MKICSKVIQVIQEESYVKINTNGVEVRIWFLTDEIIRIRAGFENDFSEESYNLMLTGWEDRFDEFLEGKRRRILPKHPSFEDKETYIILHGDALDVVIEKDPFIIKICDKNGLILHQDVSEMAYFEDVNKRRIHASVINEGDHFYGFGERSGSFNKYEKFMTSCQTDAFGYNAKETDALYKHIPFFIKLNDKTRNAVGYFYHNTYECDFDIGRKYSNYWGRHSAYRVNGGDIDYFFIAGPTIKEVVSRYTDLTGKSAMLPKSALGYLGSSMYYSELPKDSDDAILEFIDNAREESIPISGFQLSSGYTAQNTQEGSKRCVFMWDNNRFKDPSNFFYKMKEKGIVVSPNVKPGILLMHPRISEFEKEEIFVKESDSDKPFIGKWWGGKGVFADFTNPKTR